MVQGAIKDTTTYVNYVYNISSKGTAQVSSQLLGMSSLTSSVLGQLAFQTSSYLSTTEGHILTFGTLAVAGFTKATSQAIEFDYALKNIEAIAGSSNMSSLGEQAMAMSNKYGVAVSEMTEGLESLARAGISANNMPKVLEEGMKLAKLEGLDLETAMTSLISTTNLLNTSGIRMDSPEYPEEIARQNQHIVSTSEVAPIGAQDIIDTLKHVGGYASSTNLDQDDLFAVIAQLGAKGTRGEMAGTSLRAFVSAGQKDQAQRALERIGLSTKDLWENDETMMSITDMKDVLDEAMEAKGYTKQEKLEFYSDFAGYKQANQIMKIDTSSAREYKEQINDAWSLGDKLQHILGSTQANLQSIFQTSVNFLTKVGQNALTLLSPLIWAAKTILDVVTNIPFMDKIFGFGLVLVGARAIATIFNKIVPTIASMSKGMGGFKKFISDTKKELYEMKDVFIAVKKAIKTGDMSYFEEKSRINEFQRISDDDLLKHRGIEELGDSSLINYYLLANPVTDKEKKIIAKNKEKEYQDLLKEVRKLRNETPEQRNKRQESQNTPKPPSEKIKVLQEINTTISQVNKGLNTVTITSSELSNALRRFSDKITSDGTYNSTLFDKIKDNVFKVEIVGSERIIPVHEVGNILWSNQRKADQEREKSSNNESNDPSVSTRNERTSNRNERSVPKTKYKTKHVVFGRTYQDRNNITDTKKIGTPALNIANFGELVDLDSIEGIVTRDKIQQAINMVTANESKRIFKFSGKTKDQLMKELQRNLDKLFGVGGTETGPDGITPRDNILDMIAMMAGAGELAFSTDTSYDSGRAVINEDGTVSTEYYDSHSGVARVKNKAAKEDMKSIFGAKEHTDASRQIKLLLSELSPYTREGKKINASDSQIAVLYQSMQRLFGPEFAEVYEQTKIVGNNFEQLHATMTDPGVLKAIDSLTDKDDIMFFRAIKKRMDRGEGAFSEQIYDKFKKKMRKISGNKNWDFKKVTNEQRFMQLQAMMDIADQKDLIAE